jgi:hypothetical protein
MGGGCGRPRRGLGPLDLAARNCEPGVPAGCATAGWRPDRVRVEAAAADQPGDEGIRVPHLAGVQFVAFPYGPRHRRSERKQLTCSLRVVGQAAWTFHRLGNVRDDAVAPEAELVAEDPQPTRPGATDRAFADDAALRAVAGSDRRRLWGFRVMPTRRCSAARAVAPRVWLKPSPLPRSALCAADTSGRALNGVRESHMPAPWSGSTCRPGSWPARWLFDGGYRSRARDVVLSRPLANTNVVLTSARKLDA